MKTALIPTAIALFLLLLAKGKLWDLNPKSSDKKPSIVQVFKKATTPATPTPEKEEPLKPRATPAGWMGTHTSGDGYEWYVPEDKEITKEFPISGMNTMYRIKSDCLVDLIPKKGSNVTSFKVDSVTGKRYLLINGTISDKEWPEEEFKKVGMATKAILFRKIEDGPLLDVKLGIKD